MKIKVSKSDRNIKRTFRSTDIEGYRGGEEVETLVNYIENENQDKSKSKKNKPNMTDDKIKKKINKKNKVKRYNSLEELRSTKEFVDEETQINAEKSYSSKNLDRYSWGKAEISFLQSATTNADSDISKTTNDIWSTFSMESLLNDCSGFYLVTNKKKARKKMQLCLYEKDANTQYTENNKCTNHSKAKHQLHKKNIANEKKIGKLLNARRKSFSSVPQSDMSDCSDVESVHSLPDSYTKHPSTAESYLSYAEIIRKSSDTQNTDVGKNENVEIVTKQISGKKVDNEKSSGQKNENGKNGEKEITKSSSLGSELHKIHEIPRGLPERSTNKKESDQNFNKMSEEFKRKRKTKEYSFVNQPAVIMKDCNVSAVNELVFGFDINKELLCDDDSDSCRKVTKNNRNSGLATKQNRSSHESMKADTCLEFNYLQKAKHSSEYTKPLNCPTNRNNSDLENIVNFVSSGNYRVLYLSFYINFMMR